MAVQAQTLPHEADQAKQQVREIFDKWAPEYEQDSQQITLEYARSQLHEVVRLRDGLRVLDVSCGTGNTLLKICEISLYRGLHDLELVGIDLSSKMVEIARLKAGLLPNIRFQEGDAENIPAKDGYFDYVLSSAAFHWYPAPVESLREGLRVLRPGGKMVIVDKALVGAIALTRRVQMRLGLYKPRPEIYRLYFPAQLEGMFKEAGFAQVEIMYHRAPLLVPVTLPVVTVVGTKSAADK